MLVEPSFSFTSFSFVLTFTYLIPSIDLPFINGLSSATVEPFAVKLLYADTCYPIRPFYFFSFFLNLEIWPFHEATGSSREVFALLILYNRKLNLYTFR